MRGLYGEESSGRGKCVALLGGTAPPAAPSAEVAPAHPGQCGRGAAPLRMGALPGGGAGALRCSPRCTSAGASATWRTNWRASASRTAGRPSNSTRVNQAFAILTGADTTVTSFGEGQPQAQGQGVRQSVAGRAADRRQSAAGASGQSLRDVDHQGRQGEGGRHVPIGAGWQRDAHTARRGGEHRCRGSDAGE